MDQPASTTPPLPPPKTLPLTQETPSSKPIDDVASISTPVAQFTAPSPAPVSSDRPLNVSDALGYLDEVKNRFHDRPDVYNHFLDIMKDFKGQVLTTPGVIERVSLLFSGHPELISGFNTFLPPGYRIECSAGEKNSITVTTPNGTLTQNATGSLTMQYPRSVPPSVQAAEPTRVRNGDGDPQFAEPQGQPPMEVRQPGPVAATLISSKPSTPLPRSHAHTPQPPPPQARHQPSQPPPQLPSAPPHPAHIPLPPPNAAVATLPHPGFANPLVLSPAIALNASSTTANAASVLGGMHRVTAHPEPAHPAHPPAAFHPSLPQAQPPIATPISGLVGPGLQPQPQAEFNHAIQYINRIKTRFADEPETYKQFLEILQTYQKEQRLLPDVYAQVTQLFRGAPDLIDEFKLFLPDTNANQGLTPGLIPPASFVGTPMASTGGTVGVMGVLGQTGTPGPASGQAGSSSQAGPSRETEWTMEVQSVKGEKGPSYRRKVGGSDLNREGPPVKKRRRAPEKEAKVDREREKEREREHNREREKAPARVATRIRKPIRHHPRDLSPLSLAIFRDSLSPTIPPSVIHHHPSLPPLLQVAHPAPPQPISAPVARAAPEVFLDRVKRALDDRDAWEEFLKLLSLFSTDIIEEDTLLELAAPFLGGEGTDLDVQFRDILGIDRARKEDFGEMPKTAGHIHGYVQSTGMGSAFLNGPKDKFGPSYRRLPDSETTLACSGRDELCRSVLNDDWVSHPTWASEESGFIAHKKNSYEEALHKSEEERHEYHVHLEAMAHTISLLEPIAHKISEMTAEDRATFRLKPDLGDHSKSIHQKIIKKVYGRENAQEVFLGLQDNPSVAVPVVLDRLKLVDAEWKKNKREWEKVWREVDSRNFYKSLDHQGVGFKANDKKAITSKALVIEIERLKEDQDLQRQEEEASFMERGVDDRVRRTKRSRVLPRHQLEYDMHDESVLQDVIKLSLSYLERNDQRQSGSAVLQYNAVERRRIEAFLRHFVMQLFGVGPEFDAAFGPPIDQAEWEDLGLYVPEEDEESPEEEETVPKNRKNGKRSGGGGGGGGGGAIGAVSAGDLKTKLNKTKKAMEKTHHRKARGSSSKGYSNSNSSYHRSPISSGRVSPLPPSSEPISPVRVSASENTSPAKDKGKSRAVDLDDVWLRLVDMPDRESMGAGNVNGVGHGRHGSFFCNNTFYSLLRLLQLLYSRLMVCKTLASELSVDPSTSFLPNPIAVDLGLTDTAGPASYFVNLTANHDRASLRNPAEYFYVHLLDLVEKVFDGELEQFTFEENTRFMFGTRAFVVFTLDKLCAAICKQVQAVVQEGRCHELMNMLEQQRARSADLSGRGAEAQNIIRYRRQAEDIVGAEENLFRIDWFTGSKVLRIQLLDKDDLSVDPPPPLPGWRITTDSGAAQTYTPEAVKSRMTARWSLYVQSYVLRYPTEGRRIGVGRKTFLKKTLLDEDADELIDTRWMSDDESGHGLEVMVGLGTCKLYYASGCEEATWRVRTDTSRYQGGGGGGGGGPQTNGRSTKRKGKKHRKRRRSASGDEQQHQQQQQQQEPLGGEEEEELGERERLNQRAQARARERKKWILDFDRGVLFKNVGVQPGDERGIYLD